MCKRKVGYQSILLVLLVLFLPSVTSAEQKDSLTFKDVSVHDPSVIKVDDTYYVFGSHLTAAKTTDFIEWELIATGVNKDNPLFENVTEELAEALEWANSDTLWALDVIELNGKYYMYYNACQGDSPRSALGVAVADEIEGPYTDLGIFLKSGMWNEKSEDGSIYDANTHPNVIDPHTFFDKDGKLWMVYGSYSGGIFILEMDEQTGFPLEGQGYGKKLMGGNHSRMEGPYIQYSPETDYYYLYITYGGLSADGGYNMRVSRSKTPDGPYVDSKGQDMIDAHGPAGTFFDDAAIDPYGVKIMGNHVFQKSSITADSDMDWGYVSPGHNSVYLDEETGRNYLIFHTRFPNKGEGHEVRVHEIVMNEHGWPVVAPIRYTGENKQDFSQADIYGDYQIVRHGLETTDEMKKSQMVALNENQSISGEVDGSWDERANHQATITIGTDTFTGVFIKQWDPYINEETMTFSALSENGEAIWGVQMPNRSDAEMVEDVKGHLSLGEVTSIIADIDLPKEGPGGTRIEWQSSNTKIISDDGKVSRPMFGEKATHAKLTATITKGESSATKTFTITVLPENESGLVAYYPFDSTLQDESGNGESATVIGELIDQKGGTITFEDGKFGKSAYFNGKSGLLLPNGMISSNQYTVSVWLKPEALTSFSTAFFGATASDNWISLVPSGHDHVDQDTLVWSGEQWYDARTGLKIKEDEWTHIAFTVDDGEINVYVNGEKSFSGTDFPNVFTRTEAIFTLGVNYWDTPYQGFIDELLIYNQVALSDKDIQTYYQKGIIPGLEEELEKGTSKTTIIWTSLIGTTLAIIFGTILLYARRKR